MCGRNATLLLVFILALIYFVDLNQVFLTMSKLPVQTLVGTLLILSLDRIIMGYKWAHLLRTTGSIVSIRKTIGIYYQSAFSSVVLPNNLGAEALRLYLGSRMGIPTSTIMASMIMEKLIAVIAAVVLAGTGMVYLAIHTSPNTRAPALAIALVAVLCVAGLYGVLHKPTHRMLGRVTRRIIPKRAFRTLVKLSSALVIYNGHYPRMFQNFLLALTEHLLQFAVTAMLGIALGVTIPIMTFLAGIAVVTIVHRVMVYVQSWMLAETITVVMYALLGLSKETAVALAFASYVTMFLATLPGAYLLVRNNILKSYNAASQPGIATL